MFTKGGREGERNREEESGLPQWVMAAWNSRPNASPFSTCLPPFSTSAQVYLAPKFRALQHRGKVGRDCLTELISVCDCVSQSYSVCLRVGVCVCVCVCARVSHTGKKTERKRRERTFVLYLWSGPLGWQNVTHSAHYLQFSKCLCLPVSVRVCVCIYVCICNFLNLVGSVSMSVRMCMFACACVCVFVQRLNVRTSPQGRESKSIQQCTHFLSLRSLSPSPSYDLFSSCYESDPCGCYWEWVSEDLRLCVCVSAGVCVCAPVSLCDSAAEAKLM